MRVRGATAIVVLIATLVAGYGGGSASTGAAQRAAGLEEEEGGFVEEGEPGPRHVQEGEMVAGEEGWVRTPVGVFWTPDGGRTWRPITPPVRDPGLIDGIYFANPRHDWALWDTGREGDSRPSMYRTGDGGRTWRRARLRAYDQFAPVAEVSFSLVDGRELFALTKVDGDPALYFGPLFVSRDAGRHWRALPSPPDAGEVSFETSRRGWIAGGRAGQSLFRTVDGGRTWEEVVPGKPLGSPPPTELESIHDTRWTSYTAPLLGPDGHGILGMVEASEKEGSTEATRAVIWRTNDFGRSWQRSASVELPDSTADYEAREVFVRRGRSRSFIVRDPLGGAYTVVGPDGRAGPLRPSHGLPRDSDGFTFSGARHGFAFPFFGNRSSLSFTADGGRDWTQVPVPRAPR
jgi:photosystem II stability/assembly factor-like uncharacterized protein